MLLVAASAHLAPAPGIAPAAWAAPQIGETRSDLQEVQTRIRELQKEIADTEESRSDVADALAAAGKAISAAGRRLRQTVAERTAAEVELQVLEKRSEVLQQRIDGRHELLGRWLRQHYQRGTDGRVVHFLVGSDPGQMARNSEYMRYVGKANLALIEAQRSDLADQLSVVETIRGRRERLALLVRQQEEKQDELAKARAEHASRLASLNTQLRAQRTQVGTLKQDERRMERLIDGLERLAREQQARRRAELERRRREARAAEAEAAARKARSAAVESPDGRFSAGRPPAPEEPVVGHADQAAGPSLPVGVPFERLKGRLKTPLSGELLGRFGEQRANGGTSWKGVFIRAGAGSQVRAVAAGEVVFADWLRGFGNLIILDHGDGYLSIYGNNEQLLRSTGQKVSGGDAIASVGTGGSSDESGLYFEIRHRGQPVDPLKWVRLR